MLDKSMFLQVEKLKEIKGTSIESFGFYYHPDDEVFTGLNINLRSGETLEVFLTETPAGLSGLEWDVVDTFSGGKVR